MSNHKREINKVLVTGGAGFIGSAFIRHLLSLTTFQGLCINYDALTYAGNLANLQSVQHDPRYLFAQGDISDEETVEAICKQHGVDTIVHFAAESHVDRSIVDPQAFVKTNVLGTFHLLEVVKRNPSIHFHHVSTDEVYGSLGSKGLFTEESPYRPNSPYSASKAASDHLVRAYHHTYNLSTTLSNCSNNYGPYHFPEKLIPLMILNCFEGKPLPIYGDGQQIRDWLHVQDHAEALFLILQKGTSGETYNIGGNAERKNIDIVHEIISLVAKSQGISLNKLEKLITFVKDRPGHDLRYAIDCSKLKSQLQWAPSRHLNQGLKETVDWYAKNSEWVNAVRTGEYRQWLELNYSIR